MPRNDEDCSRGRSGLASIPRESGYAAVIRDVLAWYRANPGERRLSWQRILETWDKNERVSRWRVFVPSLSMRD
jgi:hypothetical protein